MAEPFVARVRHLPLARSAARKVLAVAGPALLLAILLLSAPPAHAQSLDAARAAGIVGERYDGLLVIRQPNAPAAVRAMVENVNEQRRDIYAKRAAEQDVPPAQVGRLYASQIAAKAPNGTWFLLENGQWKQK